MLSAGADRQDDFDITVIIKRLIGVLGTGLGLVAWSQTNTTPVLMLRFLSSAMILGHEGISAYDLWTSKKSLLNNFSFLLNVVSFVGTAEFRQSQGTLSREDAYLSAVFAAIATHCFFTLINGKISEGFTQEPEASPESLTPSTASSARRVLESATPSSSSSEADLLLGGERKPLYSTTPATTPKTVSTSEAPPFKLQQSHIGSLLGLLAFASLGVSGSDTESERYQACLGVCVLATVGSITSALCHSLSEEKSPPPYWRNLARVTLAAAWLPQWAGVSWGYSWLAIGPAVAFSLAALGNLRGSAVRSAPENRYAQTMAAYTLAWGAMSFLTGLWSRHALETQPIVQASLESLTMPLVLAGLVTLISDGNAQACYTLLARRKEIAESSGKDEKQGKPKRPSLTRSASV